MTTAVAPDGEVSAAGAIERVGAFFDLDRTIIAKASMAAFRAPLRAHGLLSVRALARTVVGQLVYLHLGARDRRLGRLSESLLRLAAGWSQSEIASIVEEALERVVEPIIYAEAVELIDLHRAEGDVVVIVSASPEEIVVPLGKHLGVRDVIASRAELDRDGRYTGRIAFAAHGEHKAAAVRAFAIDQHIDLERSFAYSDSSSDLPMLEAVGHPVAVNPDRRLARIAAERDWEERRFDNPIRLRDRMSVRPSAPVVVSASAALLGMSAAALGWWLGRRRGRTRLMPGEVRRV
jgi:HAD superfamily hydrolase (TIGR01490 family)